MLNTLIFNNLNLDTHIFCLRVKLGGLGGYAAHHAHPAHLNIMGILLKNDHACSAYAAHQRICGASRASGASKSQGNIIKE